MIYATILALTSLLEPSGFIIKIDANKDASYVIKYNDVIVKSGEEVTVFFFKDTVIELTFTYLDGYEEVTKKVQIEIRVGYTSSYTIRLRAYPARIRT